MAAGLSQIISLNNGHESGSGNKYTNITISANHKRWKVSLLNYIALITIKL